MSLLESHHSSSAPRSSSSSSSSSAAGGGGPTSTSSSMSGQGESHANKKARAEGFQPQQQQNPVLHKITKQSFKPLHDYLHEIVRAINGDECMRGDYDPTE